MSSNTLFYCLRNGSISVKITIYPLVDLLYYELPITLCQKEKIKYIMLSWKFSRKLNDSAEARPVHIKNMKIWHFSICLQIFIRTEISFMSIYKYLKLISLVKTGALAQINISLVGRDCLYDHINFIRFKIFISILKIIKKFGWFKSHTFFFLLK